jgi:hypothetical protein
LRLPIPRRADAALRRWRLHRQPDPNYGQRNGGLQRFGYPITEKIKCNQV